MSILSERLRALSGFPSELPVLDLAAAPAEPMGLFLAWLEEEIARGSRQPHAMTFQTLAEDGGPEGRTLILKDVDEHGLHVATSRSSRKGRQLARDPRAAMTFFWREAGRQVRIAGRTHPLSRAISEADWLARPTSDGRPNPDWQVYALQPDRVEFLQATQDRRHHELHYRLIDGSWAREA
ncbi:pyridoxal 5'-phosphate synthase [Brachybacterium sp. YJGR34]|uniref:pyridoxine/pyridoxamine 5'-phosphate oxidase n=1 Tax=Brachybacterium sp. YJGR34 TaxID=2059911 RepID=UPI000E0ABCAF|nr:pyridoxamine 5'-phosphate oxidase family protein [Brachybacterium sp. YJGR34]